MDFWCFYHLSCPFSYSARIPTITRPMFSSSTGNLYNKSPFSPHISGRYATNLRYVECENRVFFDICYVASVCPVDIVWRCNVFFSAFCMLYWVIFEIKLFNLAKIFIRWFFHSVLMQYFWLIRGIHISTRNLIFLYQGVVKSSLIAKNYVFRTPPLTILFFRRIRPRHSWEQLLQQSPHPSMQPLHPALRSSSVLSLQATSRYSHLESGIYDC